MVGGQTIGQVTGGGGQSHSRLGRGRCRALDCFQCQTSGRFQRLT